MSFTRAMKTNEKANIILTTEPYCFNRFYTHRQAQRHQREAGSQCSPSGDREKKVTETAVAVEVDAHPIFIIFLDYSLILEFP